MKSIDRLSPTAKFLLVLLINFFIPGLGNLVVIGRSFGNCVLFFLCFWAWTGGNHAVTFGWAVLMAIKALTELFPPESVTNSRIRRAYPEKSEPITRSVEAGENSYASSNFNHKLRELEKRDFNAELVAHKKKTRELDLESRAEYVSDEEFAWADRQTEQPLASEPVIMPQLIASEQAAQDSPSRNQSGVPADYSDYVTILPKAVSQKNEPLHVYAKDSTKPRSDAKIKPPPLPSYSADPVKAADKRASSDNKAGARLVQPELPTVSSDQVTGVSSPARDGLAGNDSAHLKIVSDSSADYKPYQTASRTLSPNPDSNASSRTDSVSPDAGARLKSEPPSSSGGIGSAESDSAASIGSAGFQSASSSDPPAPRVLPVSSPISLTESSTANLVQPSSSTLLEQSSSASLLSHQSVASSSGQSTASVKGATDSLLKNTSSASLLESSALATAKLSKSGSEHLVTSTTEQLLNSSAGPSIFSLSNPLSESVYADPLQAVIAAGSSINGPDTLSSSTAGSGASGLSEAASSIPSSVGSGADGGTPFGHEFFGSSDVLKLGSNTADIFAAFGVPINSNAPEPAACPKCGVPLDSKTSSCSGCSG